MKEVIITENKKAYFNYQILEKKEAGIILTGPEVKSVKKGQVNLKDSYAVLKDSEIWLLNLYIAPFKQAAGIEQNPLRSRKLLLNKREISSLIGKLQSKGLTLIPLKIYLKGGLIKIELGLGKGKTLFDKRETLKKKDQERELRRELK